MGHCGPALALVLANPYQSTYKVATIRLNSIKQAHLEGIFMRTIQLLPEQDIETFIQIALNAYPGFYTNPEVDRQRLRQRFQEAESHISLHALYENGEMLGGMRFHDFTMNWYGRQTLVGGLGAVAVDLRHKKEKVARDMVRYYLRHYRAKRASLTSLYPFRPDFYKKMGFGYGTKMNQYVFGPANLPGYGDKSKVVFLSKADAPAVADCYGRYQATHHGLFARSAGEFAGFFDVPNLKVMGYQEGEQLRGYFIMGVKPGAGGSFLSNDMQINEIVYDSPPVLLGLLAFLQSQADQIERIILNIQDDTFHHLLQDPRNQTGHILPFIYHESNTQGLGVMYRVVNAQQLWADLAEVDLGGQSGCFRLVLKDSFLPENDGEMVVEVRNGRCRVNPTAVYETTLSLEVSDFSSWVMGTISLERLVSYGLATIDHPEKAAFLYRLWHGLPTPLCLSRF